MNGLFKVLIKILRLTELILITFKSLCLAVSEVNQKVDIKLWYLHEWQDDRLSWDPAEYGNIKYLHIPSDNLWKPDLAIYNNADGDFIIMETVRAKVSHTGSVVWKPPIIAKTFCEILVADFPFGMSSACYFIRSL